MEVYEEETNTEAELLMQAIVAKQQEAQLTE